MEACQANDHFDDTKRGRACLRGMSDAYDLFLLTGQAFEDYLAGDAQAILDGQDRASPLARTFGRAWSKCTLLSGDER